MHVKLVLLTENYILIILINNKIYKTLFFFWVKYEIEQRISPFSVSLTQILIEING